MNFTTTLSPENQKESGAEKWQLLVVVSVLGTLLSVVLLLGCVWVCVVSNKYLRRQRRPTRPEPDRGGDNAFPPAHRDTVDLGCLPDSLAPRRSKHFNENTDNSGISRCLGLGASYSTKQLPTLPTPMSWTPSPPFNPHRMHARRRESVVGGSRGRECDLGDTTEPHYGSRAPTSPSNPHYNTPTSGNYYNYMTRRLDHQPEERRRDEYEVWYTDRPYYYNRNDDRAPKTNNLTHQRPFVDYKYVENIGKYLPNRGRYLSVPTENPVRKAWGGAYSTCHDQPSHHRHAYHPQHDYKPECSRADPSRSRRFDNLASDPLATSRMDTVFVDNDERECLKRTTTHRLPATSNREAETTRSYQAHTTLPVPHLRLVKDSEHQHHTIPNDLSLISPKTKPQGMKRYQVSSDQEGWVSQHGEHCPSRLPPERCPSRLPPERCPSRLPPEHRHLNRHHQDERHASHDPPEHHHQHHKPDNCNVSQDQLGHQQDDPHDPSHYLSQHDPDQEVRRRLALKYGFCQTCGVYTSPKQCLGGPADVHRPRQSNRSTQSQKDGHNSSVNDIEELIHDPTPSLSWDNLTPEPLSIFADTLANARTLEGTTIATLFPSLSPGDIPHDEDDVPHDEGDVPHE
nr:uncharacterized protein LOC123770415 isoform X1 [Procambarus clarkii]